jgi:hypothetical protein
VGLLFVAKKKRFDFIDCEQQQGMTNIVATNVIAKFVDIEISSLFVGA